VFDTGPASREAVAWAAPGVARTVDAAPCEPSAELRGVRELLDALRAGAPGALPDGQVVADAKAVFAAVEALQALGVRYLAEVDRRRLHGLDDCPTTSSWVRAQALPVTGAQVALARRLDALPLLADQLLSGRVPLVVAQGLQAALTRVRPHVDRPDGLIDGQPAEEALLGVVVDGVTGLVAESRGGFRTEDDARALRAELEAVHRSTGSELRRLEAAFLVLAGQVEADQLVPCLRQLTDALLPAQLEERARRAAEQAGLRLVPQWGSARTLLDAELSPECAERLHAVLQAELARDPEAALDTGAAARLRAQDLDPYDPELTCGRPRSRAERLHDAFSAMLGRYLAAGLGGQHDKQAVQVVVTVSADALEGRAGALPARGASGAHLPGSLVRRWACDSAVVRQVLDLRGRVVETSHTERTLKAHERRALVTQTGGVCQGAGCTRSGRDPAARMHAHHGSPWARTGTTSLADAVYLCERTHQDVHEGKVVRLKDGRRLGPDGWVT